MKLNCQPVIFLCFMATMPYKQLVNVAKMFVTQMLAAKMSTANMRTANVPRTLGTMVLKYTPDTGNCPA